MRLSPERQSALIGDIYDASLHPELWPKVLRQCADIWQARFINFAAGDKLNPHTVLIHNAGGQPHEYALYEQGGFADLDIKVAGQWLDRTVTMGQLSTNQHAFGSIDNWKQAAGRMYTDFYQRIDVLYQMGAMLEWTDYRFSYLGFHRGESKGPWSMEDTEAGQFLIPHFRRALQIHHQLSHVREMQARLYRMLDRMVAAVLLLDAAGRVRYANPAAEALLSRHTALRVGLNHEFAVRDDALQHRLSQLIHSAIRTGLREKTRIALDEAIIAGGVLGIRTANSASPLMLTVTPLSEMSGYGELASDGITAGVFITDPSAHRVLARPLLQQHFQLSEREMDVCEAFVDTATLENIADALGLSLNTVRAHIKTIYEKTGHRSQAELMKLLLGLTIEFEHIQ